MARITVEDCIDKFPSRFELVLVASNRARKLHAGEIPTLDKDNDKNTVIALREIASDNLKKEQLQNELIEEYQTTSFTEDEEQNEIQSLDDDSENLTNEEDLNNEEGDKIDNQQHDILKEDSDESTQSLEENFEDELDDKNNSEINSDSEDNSNL